jgi:hypothetical protein
VLKTTIISFLLVTLLPQNIFGTAPLPDRDTRKTRVFIRIERAFSGVKRLACDFVEEKHLAMLQGPVFSKGSFYFEKPDRLRWERITPLPSGFALHGNKAVRWRGKNGRPETFDLRQETGLKAFADHLIAWIRADFAQLAQGYSIRVIREDPVVLKLLPTSASEKNYIDHLLMEFSGDLSHVRIVEIHEKDEDFTRIRFMNPVINGPRRKDIF